MSDIGESITNFFFKKQNQGVVRTTLNHWVAIRDGRFGFNFDLPKGTPYEIQTSVTLVDWQTLQAGKAEATRVDFTDKDAPDHGNRFYRVVSGNQRSTNVIGYVRLELQPGFSMVSNPFSGPPNTYEALFPKAPNGTALHKFDLLLFRLNENEVKDGKWLNPLETLTPGEGAIFQNPSYETIRCIFCGEVMQGDLALPVPAGFSIRSSMLPVKGKLQTELSFPIAENDAIHLYDRAAQKYAIYTYEKNAWNPKEPEVGLGESFWVGKSQPGNWTRHFVVT